MQANVSEAALPASMAFKLAMRRLAATVAIISTMRDGQRFGMTATAVTSVAAEPPTLLVCVNSGASIHDPIHVAGRFCVNLLGSSHADLVRAFSGKVGGVSRFSYGTWIDVDGLPVLTDAQASLSCVTRQEVSAGTHTIFIGEVGAVRLSGDISPLLYQDGSLATAQLLDLLG